MTRCGMDDDGEAGVQVRLCNPGVDGAVAHGNRPRRRAGGFGGARLLPTPTAPNTREKRSNLSDNVRKCENMNNDNEVRDE